MYSLEPGLRMQYTSRTAYITTLVYSFRKAKLVQKERIGWSLKRGEFNENVAEHAAHSSFHDAGSTLNKYLFSATDLSTVA